MRTINQFNIDKKFKPVTNMFSIWENIFNELIIPRAERITARPIGIDLVSVQPLAAPIGVLNYSDYSYSFDYTPIVNTNEFPFWRIHVIFNNKNNVE
jgi:hypothetical protein